MVLFYTIIFSYWPSESCENFSCSENISFIIHLSAVYLNIRFNKVGISMKKCKDSTYKSWFCIQSNTNIATQYSFCILSTTSVGLYDWWGFLLSLPPRNGKKGFFTFIAICPRFYFITPVSTSTRWREKTISSNVKKRVNKYVSIFSRDVVWVWY